MNKAPKPAILALSVGLGIAFALPASASPVPTTSVEGLAADGGHGVPGATVELFEDVDVSTAKSGSGQEVVSSRVGTATTNSSGRYSFSVPVGATTQTYRNFHVVITSAARQTVEFFTVDKPSGSVRVGAPTTWFARPVERGTQAASNPAEICRPTLMRQDVPNQKTVVSNIFLLTGDVGVYGSITQSSTSKLGVGVGVPGAFSAGGTRTVATSQTIMMGTRAHAERQLFQTYSVYEYQYYSAQCNRAGYHNYMVPKFLQGGSAVQNVAAPSLPYCTSYLPGDKATVDTSTAHNFGGGVTTSGKIGINLSAQTGWTRSASITYFSNYPKGMTVCGQNNYPGQPNSGMNGGFANYPGGSATSPPRVSAEESTRPGRADEIGVFPVKPVTPRRVRRRGRLAGVVVVSFIAGGCSPGGSGGGGPLVPFVESTDTCMMTPADDPVAFGSAWVKLTGDRPVTFRGTELLDAHGIELVEGALMPPGKLPQGTGVGFPFPPTTYRPAPVPPSVWNARLLPGAELRPSSDTYPVTVGLRLAGQVDHGTASGIRLTYSDRGRTRHVELPTALLVVSKSVYRNCGDAETALKKTPG